MHARNEHARAALPQASKFLLIVGLDTVVALLTEQAGELGRYHTAPLSTKEQRREPIDQRGALHVGRDRRHDARILHLDRDLVPTAKPCAVDLADRTGRERHG